MNVLFLHDAPRFLKRHDIVARLSGFVRLASRQDECWGWRRIWNSDGMIMKGENRKSRETTLPQCDKSHMDCPGLEPEPRRTSQPPAPWAVGLYIYIYIYIHTHTHTHTHIHTYIHTYIHTNTKNLVSFRTTDLMDSNKYMECALYGCQCVNMSG